MANPGIFLIQPNGELVEMNEQAYDSEDLLQTLLAKYPSLLAGNQIDPKAPRKWLLIERESGVPSREGAGGRWSADHLFLDQDAIPTIVEVKRSSDTRVRREVVGQMLDYAANAVVYWPAERLRERFLKTHGAVAEQVLSDFLDGEREPEEFWQLAYENLEDRRVRLLFVADKIPTELQRIVEFLNEQMKLTEVLAIEVKQYVQGQQKALAPRVIGRTAKAQQEKASTSLTPINDKIFFEALAETCGPPEIEAARRILDWSEKNSSFVKWRRQSFAPYFEIASDYPHIPFSVSTDGQIGINFLRMKNRFGMSNERRSEILGRFNSIAGVNLPPESVDDKRHGIPLSALVDQKQVARFLNIVEWTIQLLNSRESRHAASEISESATA